MMPNQAMQPSRRSAANLIHSFLAATWGLAAVRRLILPRSEFSDNGWNLLTLVSDSFARCDAFDRNAALDHLTQTSNES
jgi:hypothetical protein